MQLGTRVRRRKLTSVRCDGCPEPLEVGTVPGYGPDKARLCIVAEHPGETETITGRPFTGQVGQLLNATLRSYGINPAECYFDNSVSCYSKPLKRHLQACGPGLFQRIASREPDLVLTLGKVAFQAVCQTNGNLYDADGSLWWKPELNAWVLPTWHPAAVLRGGADDRFFPRITNSIWRASRFLSGQDQLPVPGQEIAGYPWTLFRTADGAKKALRYYLRQANELEDDDPPLELACDTESHAPGYGVPPTDMYLPSAAKRAAEEAARKNKKGRPHAFSDTWLMLQLYDGKRAAAIDMTVQDEESKSLIVELLRHPKILWIGHNFAAYDTQVFQANLGVVPTDRLIEDTMTMGLGLQEREISVGLEPLARGWLNAPAYKKGLKDTGYRHQKGPQNDAQWKQLGKYGVDDTYYTYHLAKRLPKLVEEEGTATLRTSILLPLAITCGKLSARGFPIDTHQIDKLEDLWGGMANRLVSSLQLLAESSGWTPDRYVEMELSRLGSTMPTGKPRRVSTPTGFNPRSSRHLQSLAYDVLRLAPTDGSTNRKFSGTAKNLHGRTRSVDADFVAGHEDTEFCQLVGKLRIYDKLVRTYVRGLVREIDKDGLIHPSFGLASTATGRLVVKPLLQVLPHYGAHAQLEDEDFAKETRRLFPSRPGYVIVSTDYKQLEMRIAWMLSGDKNLGEALMSGDMHARTASYMFRKDESIVTKADRHAAKRVSFGVAYNRSAFTLAKGPLLDVLGGMAVDESTRIRMAQKFIDAFWGLYGDYHSAQQQWKHDALEKGELVTPFGRKRRWQLITEANVREIENQAVNFPVQSTASDFCSSALIRLTDVLPRMDLGWPLYTVHDEIVCEIREDRIDEGIRVINSIMSDPPLDTNGAQFPTDSSYGPNLGDLVPWKDAA